jgi:hypothetical protein
MVFHSVEKLPAFSLATAFGLLAYQINMLPPNEGSFKKGINIETKISFNFIFIQHTHDIKVFFSRVEQIIACAMYLLLS